MVQSSNIKNKLQVLIKVGLIVMWFYMIDILLVSTISLFFDEQTLYRKYIMNHQYLLSFISRTICFFGLVITTNKNRVITWANEREVNLYKIIYYIVCGLLGWLLGTVIVNILLPMFPEYKEINTLFEGNEHVFRFIVIVIIAPFIEEYVFRGKIQGYLKQEFGIIIAIILQAIIFAGLHGLVLQQIYAFILGVYMGYIKNKEDNFMSTLIIHMIINGIGWYIGTLNV